MSSLIMFTDDYALNIVTPSRVLQWVSADLVSASVRGRGLFPLDTGHEAYIDAAQSRTS